MSFRALVLDRSSDAPPGDDVITTMLQTCHDADLMPGDVTIDVEYSSVNFKDARALTGDPAMVRHLPLIAGIDLVGTVASSISPRFAPGDRVVLNGDGIGESVHGGLAERARVRADSLVRIPTTMTSLHAAAIGTAGFTAMLCVLALERLDVVTGGRPVLVTGASGGVGSIAIALLAGRGYRVTASTGRSDENGDYLRALGAHDVIDRATLSVPDKPLQAQRWCAVIDTLGSTTLANALAQTQRDGVVAACGRAQGIDLPTTVLPFILRAVTLVGINSVEASLSLRERSWSALAAELSDSLLDSVTSVVPLAEAPALAARLLAGDLRGRTAVNVRA